MRKPLVALVAGLALALVGPTLSASAHSGGKAQLFLRKISAEPSPTAGSYDITVELIDRDSGEPMSGYAVSFEGHSGDGAHFDPTPAQAQVGGKYVATVPAAKGDWTITVRGNGAPGVGEAVPLEVTQPVAFTESATTAKVAATEGDSDGGGGGATGAIVAVVAALALLGVGGAFLMKRKAGRLAGASSS